MRDFIAFHGAKKMGEYSPPKDGCFRWRSGNPESILRDAITNRVWVVARRLDGVYTLAGMFTPSGIEPESGDYAVFGSGTVFSPPFVLTGLPWLSDLLREQGNFGFGFNRIRSESIVTELEQFLL